MQISAANLLIAAQQPIRVTAASTPGAQAKFATAPAGGEKVDASFEPIEFKPAAPAKTVVDTAARPSSASAYGGRAGLGAHIDIRV